MYLHLTRVLQLHSLHHPPPSTHPTPRSRYSQEHPISCLLQSQPIKCMCESLFIWLHRLAHLLDLLNQRNASLNSCGTKLIPNAKSFQHISEISVLLFVLFIFFRYAVFNLVLFNITYNLVITEMDLFFFRLSALTLSFSPLSFSVH